MVFKVPAPTHRNEYVSSEVALSNIDINAANNEFPKQSTRIKDRLLFTPPWENAWFLDKIVSLPIAKLREELKVAPWYENEINDIPDESLVERIKACKLNCKKAKMSHIYKRLKNDKPSYTITGSGGGGTHVYHWEERRALTNRERARLQSFPDSFVFKGTKEEVRKQIGMAVPPKGAKVIFEAVLKTFAGIKYDTIDASYSNILDN